MPAANATAATLSDLDLLASYDRLQELSPPPQRTGDFDDIRRSVNRRIVEAMMGQWVFGGPIRCSVTPAVSAAIGLMVSRSGYGTAAGAAIGTGVACLGPLFTRWHLRHYAESQADATLASMAEAWKALQSGQGDGYDVRLERLKPGLDSVPDGIRRRIGKIFVYLQTTASLRTLFAQVYTDCLTASPVLQSHVQTGKAVLLRETEQEAIAQKMELAHLRATVLEQQQIIHDLQVEGAHGGQDVLEAMGRLDSVEGTVALMLHRLAPLLEQLRNGDGQSVTVVHMQVSAEGPGMRNGEGCRPTQGEGKDPEEQP